MTDGLGDGTGNYCIPPLHQYSLFAHTLSSGICRRYHSCMHLSHRLSVRLRSIPPSVMSARELLCDPHQSWPTTGAEIGPSTYKIDCAYDPSEGRPRLHLESGQFQSMPSGGGRLVVEGLGRWDLLTTVMTSMTLRSLRRLACISASSPSNHP